jgi:hypothetical protein
MFSVERLQGNSHLGKAQLYMDSNIRKDSKKRNVVAWTGLIWLRTRGAGRLLSMLT